MLRRTKAEVEAQLQLPPCSRADLPVALSGVERTFYNAALDKFREAVQVGGGCWWWGGGGL